ncbi:THAP domain-containing protein 7-like [Thrips palmi]|uniref:THAP domain-containing protein 7-like n=1 Tax=Thrips palmi TaxID=161013 RepID=A0A6P8XWT4_THRPL|nr:THAP domain-containing protein 7-like [Thrips palmi]
MPKFCVLLACKNRDFKNQKTSGMRHHKFPVEDNVREHWVSFVKKCNRSHGWTTKYETGTMLCEDHFEKDCYLPSGRLARSAIPTKAPKFTMETAQSPPAGLAHITNRHSYHALDKLNNFEKDFFQGIGEVPSDAGSEETVAVDEDIMVIDMPVSPLLQDADRTLSDPIKPIEQEVEKNTMEWTLSDHILHVECDVEIREED